MLTLRIIAGALIAAFGILMTMKAQWFYDNIGTVEWAERVLGSEGGSRVFYKLFGMLIALIGFLMITGLLGRIILFFFLPLFSGMQKN